MCERLCLTKLYVTEMGVREKLHVREMCACERWCVIKLCVTKLCVREVCV